MQHLARTLTLVAALVAAPVAVIPVVMAQAADQPAQAAQSSTAPKAQAQIDRGLAYLKSQQNENGGWATGRQPPAITGLVLRVFVQDPAYDHSTDFVARGYQELLSHQLEDGGIYDEALANYNTAVSVSALAAAKNPEFEDELKQALAYLKGLQWGVQAKKGPQGESVVGEDHAWYGGWGYGGHSRGSGRPDLSNTQMALEALNEAGVPQDDPAYRAALKFVTRLQNHSETNEQPWAGNDGGFVYSPSDDGTYESQAGEYTTPDGRRALRSYGSMTYAGLKSFIYAGLEKDDPRVQAAWEWITSNWTLDGNPGMQQNDPAYSDWGQYYYYMTLARALNAYDEPIITTPDGQKIDWRVALVDKLETLQKEDGSWSGSKKWMEDNPVIVTSYIVGALQELQQDLEEHPVQQ